MASSEGSSQFDHVLAIGGFFCFTLMFEAAGVLNSNPAYLQIIFVVLVAHIAIVVLGAWLRDPLRLN